MSDFNKLLEREKHLKVYYFFCYGELIDTTEADNPEDAVEHFLKTYKPRDFDYLLEWDKKHGYYITYRYENNKRVTRITPVLRHRD